MDELLKLARLAIKSALENSSLDINDKIKKKYSKKQACFVTLTINNNLRGCMGSIEATQPLWKDIVSNSFNAAFFDPRFKKLTLEEFNKIKIELSILTIPKKIDYSSSDDLKKQIWKKGVLLRKGYFSATYLPQVWEQIKDKDEFLSSLCLKAGLSANSWKTDKPEIRIYDVESISE